MSRDCCTWSGVTCDEVAGRVIRLDLECSGLQGILDSNNTLFSLGHLQSLDLSGNYFYGSEIAPQFGRFQNMIHLDLSNSGFTGQVSLELSYLSNLVALDLRSYYTSVVKLETSSWKRIVANLTNLQELFLSGVNMSSVLPNSFMNLSTSLTSLYLREYLSENGLKGEFPEHIFNLPNLQELDLSGNVDLNGSFPQYNWSSPLRVLDLSRSGFLIDLPYLTRKLKYLDVLTLSGCKFRGSSPRLLGNFSQITSLDLSSNNFGTQIPCSFFSNLQQLDYLNLANCNFIGQLPEICSNSTESSFPHVSSKSQLEGSLLLNLRDLYLYSNKLNGTIPSWLFSLPSLQYLYLQSNQFTGHIHEFQYDSLIKFHLGYNKLQGLFPSSIFQQVNLSSLLLSSNNLSGVMPLDQFSKLKNLERLGLSYNSLSLVSINSTDFTLPNTISALDLSSCGLGEFPYSLRSLENLEQLNLSNNQIEGSIFPIGCGMWGRIHCVS
ncbi:Leucine-rich repeat, typical subtype [Trema orientale]|uniref:Leucine-rich repeat, typical subtype n=1 Tax=Trema orientale TaxID=63057 RepID=A0A2P5F6G4_TREOI|nr:Leucine-rich repeat, typical subtype [Trema orientale]